MSGRIMHKNYPFNLPPGETWNTMPRREAIDIKRNYPYVEPSAEIEANAKARDAAVRRIDQRNAADRIAQAEITPMLDDVRRIASRFGKAFDEYAGSSSKGYIGNDPTLRAQSEQRARKASLAILEQSQRRGESPVAEHDYRRQFTNGKVHGNSGDMSVAIKDLVENRGYTARVVETRTNTQTLDATHAVTIVARTPDDLDTLKRLPNPSGSRAGKLVVIDPYLKVCCPYSKYPEQARAAAAEWDKTKQGIRNERDGRFVSTVASGWTKALSEFPKGASFVEKDKLPKHVPEQASPQRHERDTGLRLAPRISDAQNETFVGRPSVRLTAPEQSR